MTRSPPLRRLPDAGRATFLAGALALGALLPLRTYVILPRAAQLERDESRLALLGRYSEEWSATPAAATNESSVLPVDRTAIAISASALAANLERGMASDGTPRGAMVAELSRLSASVGLEQIVVQERQLVEGHPYTRRSFLISALGGYPAVAAFLEASVTMDAFVVPRVVSLRLARPPDPPPASRQQFDSAASARSATDPPRGSPDPWLEATLAIDAYVLAEGVRPLVPLDSSETASLPSDRASPLSVPIAVGGGPFLPTGLLEPPVLEEMRLAGVIVATGEGESVAVFAGNDVAAGSAIPSLLRVKEGDLIGSVRIREITADSVVVELEGLGTGYSRAILFDKERIRQDATVGTGPSG